MTSMGRYVSGFVVLAVLAGFFYYFYAGLNQGNGTVEGKWACQDGAWVASGTPSTVAPSLPCVKSTASGLGSEPTASSSVAVANIVVTAPISGSAVPFPLTIEGRARTFDGAVDIRIKDSENRVIYEGYTTTVGGDAGKFGTFSVPVAYLFHKPAGDDVTVELFERSAKDGSEINNVSVPIKLALGETANIKLFFGNSDLVPSGKDSCGRVFAVDRVVPKMPGLIRRVLELLDQGPSASEFENGYETQMNPDVNIRQLTVDEGRARVDFDAQLMKDVSGACRLATLKAQIIQTLMQFPEVVDARFTVDGVEFEKLIINQ